MPSGPKKRKANKKKKTNPNPNPNSQALPPVPLQHQGNGHATEEDGEEGEEEEEVFETPRSQPPDPLDVAHLGNGSSPRVPLDEVPEEEREDVAAAAVGSLDGEENPARKEGIVVVEEEPARVENPQVHDARFYKALAENPEVSVEETVDDSASHDEEEVKIVPWQEEERLAGRSESTKDEGLVETGMEKSALNTVNVDGQVEEMPKIDDALRGTNSDRSTLPIENSTVVTEENSVAVSANCEALVEEVDTINADHKAKEMTQIDDGSNETNSDRFTEESLVGVTVTEICEILVDGVDSTSREGERKVWPQVDEGPKDAQLDKLVEEKRTLTENPNLVTEEASQLSEATAENLNKVSVGVVDTTPTPQEASDPSANAAKTEIAPRSEVARGPLVVGRATLWNCCGLLDVFTGSQK
ncbi:uncharacterized protein M6B38_201705 [Iris pallida]|uniref:Uncharacterized protein n=1 Tax=Iris pallida TaxID=29817 RepID=A0AAX6E9W4_IRIPA|nr:uncharacterized protein M6B38_201705 [Iris pallida]